MNSKSNLLVEVHSVEISKGVIDTYESLDPFSNSTNYPDAEYDLLDGVDWWQEYYDNAELKFGKNWGKISITSHDGCRGRIIEREYPISEKPSNTQIAFHNKIFLIGENSSPNLHSHFSENLIYSYESRDLDQNKFYSKGSDESIIQLIRKIIMGSTSETKIVDVIYNPSQESILVMKLADHYEFLVHIGNVKKLDNLIGLVKAKEFVSNFYYDFVIAKRIAKRFDTNYLDFLIPTIDTMNERLKNDSQGSFLTIFKQDFCI